MRTPLFLAYGFKHGIGKLSMGILLCACILRWTPEIQAEIEGNGTGKLKCTSVLIAIGPAPVGFCQVYIRNDSHRRVGAIFSNMADSDVNSLGQRSPTDKSCYIYRDSRSPSVFVCECNVTVTQDQAYSWVQQFFSQLDVTTAYIGVLSTHPVSSYLSDRPINDLPTPFMRALRTSHFQGTPCCPYLEQPNVISGLSAQILTHTEMYKIRCVLYICYTDSLFVESDTIKAFRPIIQYTPVKDIYNENPSTSKALEKLLNLHRVHDSLYL